MTSSFGKKYASLYDALYADKDYAGECDLVEQTLARFATGPSRRVVDFGCGTGSHALLLAERGFDVTGVDISDEMVRRAREKAAAAGVSARFVHGDVRTVDVGTGYDVALLMFAVLGYQLTNDDVRAALRRARAHLRPDGLLIFDVWYGPGVLTDPPRTRKKVVATPTGDVTRIAEADLDTLRHICRVRYRILDSGREHSEEHVVRFFFPLELELLLRLEGLEPLRISRFGDLDEEPDASTWNALVVAHAR